MLAVGIAVGGAALAGGAIGGGVAAASTGGGAFRRESLVLEVCCLGDTWRVSDVVYAEDAGDYRGQPFAVEGYLYPEGTIPAGDGFVPTTDGAIGRWFCRGGVMTYTARPEPHGQTTQTYAFGPVSREQLFPPQLLSDGLEGSFETDQVSVRAVTGGTYEWMGASGQVSQILTGFNTTEFTDGTGSAPNFRFEFDLLVPNL
jgi:hypothetical protein